MSYIFSTKLDRVRKFRARFEKTVFMWSAIRKKKEIENTYGKYRYRLVRPLTFQCRVLDDSEAMFKPAIYRITDYQPLNPHSELAKEEAPIRAVSMVGCYRNLARRGQKIAVSGMLERVESVEAGDLEYQVVVGTGTCEDEYIWPITD